MFWNLDNFRWNSIFPKNSAGRNTISPRKCYPDLKTCDILFPLGGHQPLPAMMTESCFFVRMKWSFLRITWAWCYKFPKGSQTERESLVKLGEACVCLWIGHCAAPSLHLAAAHTTITSWTADAFSLFPSLAESACLSPTRCFSCQLRLIRRLLCTDWNTVRLAKYSTKCLCWNSSLWMCSDLSTPFYIAISEISRGLKALSSFFFFFKPWTGALSRGAANILHCVLLKWVYERA